MTGGRGLVLSGVAIALGGRPLIEALELAIEPGEIVTIMGPSGSGKSSLLNFVCGTLDSAFTARGRILLDGADVTPLPPERRKIGILFQDDLLFPHLSVAGNLSFGLAEHLRDKEERKRRVAAALAEAGLAGFGERDTATLSGGQRARVALLRTLLAEPRALLLDEPFGNLDAGLRDRMRAFVFDHARAGGLPVLLVTHDPDDAAAAGGRRLTLDADGRCTTAETDDGRHPAAGSMRNRARPL